MARAKVRFLEAYSRSGLLSDGLDAARVTRSAVEVWLRSDLDFASQFAEAGERVADAFEREAVRRAVDGVDEPVYQRGELVGHVRRYSDALLLALLRGTRPAKFRDQAPAADAQERRKAFEAELQRLLGQERLQQLAAGARPPLLLHQDAVTTKGSDSAEDQDQDLAQHQAQTEPAPAPPPPAPAPPPGAMRTFDGGGVGAPGVTKKT